MCFETRDRRRDTRRSDVVSPGFGSLENKLRTPPIKW